MTRTIKARSKIISYFLFLVGCISLSGNFACGQKLSEKELLVNERFLVKPYVQMGNNPSFKTKDGSLEIVWFSGLDRGWTLCQRRVGESKWTELNKLKTFQQGTLSDKPYYKHKGKLITPVPGSKIDYQVCLNGKPIFESHTVSRKSKTQNYTFAVAGDVGANSIGQKKVAFQLHEHKPDLFLIPGDITYNRGRISEYLSNFFPIMNSDEAAPDKGAPLLRKTLTVTAIGNHDIALTNMWSGVNFSSYPDALGYYIFWSQPLNGPPLRINEKNTTSIMGNADAQLNFVRAAGSSFPRMANYSFDYGNSHWLVLDANPYMDWTNKKLRDWVDSDLKKADGATWKFVLCHQPGFTIDINHWIEQRMRQLCDLFEKHGVSVVFSGHAHTYQRTYPLRFVKKKGHDDHSYNTSSTVSGDFILDKQFDGTKDTTPQGVVYIVSGAGGASLYRKAILNSNENLFNHKFINHKHSFTLCSVEGKKFTLKQVSCDGEDLDQFTITK